jgi:hypothetical protein
MSEPREGSVWTDGAKQVEVKAVEFSARFGDVRVTYQVIRIGNYRRTTEMERGRFLSRFRPANTAVHSNQEHQS